MFVLQVKSKKRAIRLLRTKRVEDKILEEQKRREEEDKRRKREEEEKRKVEEELRREEEEERQREVERKKKEEVAAALAAAKCKVRNMIKFFFYLEALFVYRNVYLKEMCL